LDGERPTSSAPSKDQACASWRIAVTRDQPSPHGVAHLFRVLSESRRSAVLVWRVPLRRLLVARVFARLARPWGPLPTLPAVQFAPHDYPLLRFCSPPGFDPHSPPDGLSAPAPSLGFLPLQRHLQRESTHPGFAAPGTFRPRGFAPPRRFPPPEALRVCFAPLAPLGFCPSGVFPPKKPPPSRRRRSCPLDVLSRGDRRSWLAGPGRPRHAQLASRRGLFASPGPSAPRESVPGATLIRHRAGRSPPGLLPS